MLFNNAPSSLWLPCQILTIGQLGPSITATDSRAQSHHAHMCEEGMLAARFLTESAPGTLTLANGFDLSTAAQTPCPRECLKEY